LTTVEQLIEDFSAVVGARRPASASMSAEQDLPRHESIGELRLTSHREQNSQAFDRRVTNCASLGTPARREPGRDARQVTS
jgi:hypothetical protein